MVRTRFAPSPTGFLHIGSLRTAAYAYALAKHNKGQFLLRIEDTDQKRFVEGSIDGIYQILTQFGLQWDEAPITQSDRVKAGVYAQAANKLLSSGHAFYCQCEGRNAKTDGYSTVLRDPCRDKNLTSGAIKLKIPDHQKLTFHDFVINKDITWDSNTISDTVLLKTDGFPTYHLAVVVDDTFMKISHVIRAVEWLPSTPIHILVYQFLGLPMPEIGHPTDILDPSGGKLSKRKRNVSCEQFLTEGYLPEALLNFVILMGWAPKDNRELFTLDEFVTAFDSAGFQKANAMYSDIKLDWFNGQYIRRKTDEELAKLLNADPKIVALVKDRLVKLSDFPSLTAFLKNLPEVDPSLFLENSIAHLEFALANLDNLNSDLVKAQGFKVGDFFMSLRIAVCGSKFTPPIADVISILGQAETSNRLNFVIQKLKLST